MTRNVEEADSQAVIGMLNGIMSRRAAIGLVAGTAATAALAACGGDDDDDDDDDSGSDTPVATDAPDGTNAPDATDPPEPAAGGADPEAVVRLAGDQSMSDMDPRTSTGQLGVISRFNIFTPLVSVDSSSGVATPLFISELPTEEDPQSFLLQMAPGQTWHDGTDVTVEDVKYTVDWLLDEENGSLFGAVVLDIVDSLEIVDAETFRIKLKRVSGSVLDRFALITPVPQAIAERVGRDEFKISPTGNGPFQFSDFVLDDSMTMTRYEDYSFGPKAPIAEAKIIKITEGSSRINALQGGQLEGDIRVDPQLWPVLEGTDIVGQQWPGAGYNAIMLNAGSGPFADIRVRTALAHAVNRDEIATAVWNDLARPQFGPIDPANAMASSPTAPEFDPEKSIALLEEAGVAGLEIELMQGIWSTGLTMASVLQQQMQTAGFKVRVNTADSAGQYNRVFDGDWDAFSMRGNTSIIGEYADIYCRWTSRDIFNNAPAEELQPLLDALEEADQIPSSDDAGRKAAYAAIEQMIVDDARIIYLVNPLGLTGTVPSLTGLEMGPHLAPLALSSVSVTA